MVISILTIFPDMVRAMFEYGVIGQAIKKDLIQIKPIDLRNFTFDKHRSVDGRPFGGGPGMVGRVDVVDGALENIKYKIKNKKYKQKVILLSPQGRVFNQQIAREYSQLDHLILISGRYEGVDERVAKYLADEELSIGNYVLSGGEIPAMAVADTVARLIPGVLGKSESLKSESFSRVTSNKKPAFAKASAGRQEISKNSEPIVFDYPVYTEPAEYKGWNVPEILRSGDHEKIKNWREEQAKFKSGHQRLEIS